MGFLGGDVGGFGCGAPLLRVRRGSLHRGCATTAADGNRRSPMSPTHLPVGEPLAVGLVGGRRALRARAQEHHRWLASACLDSLCGAGLVAADCMRPAVRIDQGAVTAVGADAGADDQRESLGALLRRIPPPTAHVPATAASASSARLGAGIPARAGRMGPPRHPTTLQGAGPLPALPNFQASPRHTQAAPLPPPQGAEPPRLKAAGSPLQSLATQAVVAGLGAPNLSQVFVKFSF